MRTTIQIENPDDVDLTLRITMSVRDWREFRDQLGQSYPAVQLSAIITAHLNQIDETLGPIIQEEPPTDVQ